MTDFYSQNRCVCSTRSHGPLLCAFCLSFHFKVPIKNEMPELTLVQDVLEEFITLQSIFWRQPFPQNKIKFQISHSRFTATYVDTFH